MTEQADRTDKARLVADLASAMAMRRGADRVLRDALANAFDAGMRRSDIASAMGTITINVSRLWTAVRFVRDDEPIELRPDHA